MPNCFPYSVPVLSSTVGVCLHVVSSVYLYVCIFKYCVFVYLCVCVHLFVYLFVYLRVREKKRD